MKKYMIFHVPNHIDPSRKSGSHIRPTRMKEAFEKIGYEVDSVMGYKDERKRAMNRIRRKIKRGISYDFCYSESSTMPTELTERNHLPTTFGMDFGFFRDLKKAGIPIGLFYRDCYWLFDDYKAVTTPMKRRVAIAFYKRDLKKYKELVDILYLPHESMAKVLPVTYDRIRSLPPAIDEMMPGEPEEIPPLEIFYVGGIAGHYQLEMLFSAVSELKDTRLTVICRQDEWEAQKKIFEPYLCDRITIDHGGEEVYRKYIEKADIGAVFTKPSPYWDFAVPVKVYEYLKYGLPIIGNRFTATEETIEKAGFITDYDKDALMNRLQELIDDPEKVREKRKQAIALGKENLWTDRAKQVQKELLEL